MRKSFVFALILTLLSIGVLAGAAGALDGKKDDVTVTETVLHGDPSTADGLVVHAQMQYGGFLFWEIDHTAGGGTAAVCAFDPGRELPSGSAPSYAGLEVDPVPVGAFAEAINGMEPEPGEPLVLRVADYYDDYPLDFTLDSPGYTVPTYLGAMRDFFPIPTAPQMRYTYQPDPSEDAPEGAITGVWEPADSYEPLTVSSAITDEGVFFALRPNRTYDLSGFPMGYGVYFLPMSADGEGRRSPDVDGLRLVCPLDASTAEQVELFAQPEADRLFVASREGGADFLTVLSLGEMAVLQRLAIPANGGNLPVTEAHPGDGYVILLHGMQYFDLFAAGADGSYALCFSHTLSSPAGVENFGDLATEAFCAAFDGERLAVAAPYRRYDLHWTQDWPDGDDPADPDTDFYLAVYDADGLAFAAACALPLTHPYTEDYAPCSLWGKTPLSLCWPAALEGGAS